MWTKTVVERSLEVNDVVTHADYEHPMTIQRRLGGGLLRCGWTVNGVRCSADLLAYELSKVETNG